jgi:mannose-6-phosphate isomerase-like protein (cupin superfamily)
MPESYASRRVAGTGDTFGFPDGSDYTITASAGETGGSYVEMELLLPPDAMTPPLHVHPRQSEEYEVIAGRLDVYVDGDWQSLPEGESLTVAAGEPHTFRNGSGERVRVRNVHRPALGFQDYIEELWNLVQDGKIKSAKDPSSLMHLSLLWEKYEDTIVPAKVPQRAAMRAFAAVGRRLRRER